MNIQVVKQIPVQITVGENDTKFIGDSPYGTNRVERMKKLQKNLEDWGVKNRASNSSRFWT